MKIWFTSDQHYDHNNIIKYSNRPFATVGEMNEELIRRHNALVKADDIVYHLGDFSLNKQAPVKYLSRLNGEHHLIMGNHDWCHPACGKSKVDFYRAMYSDAGFQSIQESLMIDILDQEVLLHHMPYLDQEPGEHGIKHAKYRPIDKGLWLLHGHVHTAWKIKDRMINIGIDQWDYAPVSLQQIEAIIGGSDK